MPRRMTACSRFRSSAVARPHHELYIDGRRKCVFQCFNHTLRHLMIVAIGYVTVITASITRGESVVDIDNVLQ